ncbi:ABC transporter permease [Dictyobacter sp. S3.2.2.5]|uniref:ABC transporter permease n=1 Tax=Dictyobacter halimunensis TaxID=3026934 RepID=A0ABQ6FKF6_9CHLR|nr:ABC transporter permease [Dictyobacter sp. S3.2.2.5]
MGFLQYLLKRIVTYIVVLFIGITITFFLPRLLPSNPIDNYIAQMQNQAGQTLTPEATQKLRVSLEQLYGLNGNIVTQYLTYLKRIVLNFDFGPSLSSYPRPVSQMIFAALPWTIGLLVSTTIIAWLLGNGIGLVAGYFNNNRAATVLEVVGVVLYPIPYYVMALSVILLLAYVWPIFPLSATFQTAGISFGQISTILYNSALPALTLVLTGFGWNILSMKSLAYATKEEPYAVFARLKGTSDWTRMSSYVFRNAMLPQITSLVLSIGTIFNGALITEMLFSYPGLGLLMRTAAGSGDYNLLYGSITMSIIAVATAGLILDLVYPLFDPRIRYR